MSEHVEQDGAWQYTASDSMGSGVRRGRGKQGKRGRLTAPLLLPNSCWESSRCRMPTSLIRVMACSSSFRCGTSLSCAHIPQRGEGRWRSPSREGPARTRPHMSACRFSQSGGWGRGGSKVLCWKQGGRNYWINGMGLWESLQAGAAATLYVTISHASGISIVWNLGYM